MKEIVLFYFSGTGNAKKVASWFAEFAKGKGIPYQLLSIAEPDKIPFSSLNTESIIGIISPIHGFNYPKIMLRFIRGLPNGTNRVVLMNTRGSVKIGTWITPGLTGVAFMLSALLLKRKGYRIIGQIPFDMPSNWISIHPALREKSIHAIFEKSYGRAKQHFERIYSGRNDFSARKDIVQDLLISPVALAYYFVGRIFFAKSYYASFKCTNCRSCINQCPVKAIKEVDNRPFWTLKCESCMKCMNNCPVNAIETSHGLWVLVIYVTSIVITVAISYPFLRFVDNWVIKIFVFSTLLIGLLWLCYRVQHIMLKNRNVAKLISFTSFTHYKFWGRFKEDAK